MKVKVPYGYGKETIEVEVPEKRVLAVVSPNEVSEAEFRKTLGEALEKPVDSPPFGDFLAEGEEILFIVNDGTRPTPTAPILEYIDAEYDLKKYNPRFMVATGAHRFPTEDEFSFIFGKLLNKYRDQIRVHDARSSEFKYLGKTTVGTKVYLNKEALKAKRWVIITSVEPHYFAGFTGGRKSILPGISAFSTIEQNHSLYAKSGAEVLNLDNNPVHQDMEETLNFLDKEIFAINTVLGKDRTVYYLQAGDIYRSFEQAVEKAKEVFVVSIPKRADIVVTAAIYPMDVDLYQAQKALENGKHALKDEGIIILVAQCREGIGDPTFFDLLSSSSDPKNLLEQIAKNYKLGYHKAAKLVDLASKARIWAVTDLDSDLLEKAHIRPVDSLQKALDEGLKKSDSKTIFLLDGSITVPVLKNREVDRLKTNSSR